MRAAIGLVSAMACGVATGCDNPGIYEATFASHRRPCDSWVGPVMCTVVTADEGDFNSYQRVDDLDWHWGETITLLYLDIHNASSGADDWEHTYVLLEVLSIERDPVGTRYTLPKFTSNGQASIVRDFGNLAFTDAIRGTPPELIACEPALCDAVAAAENARVIVELTDDPAVPLRVVSVD